MALPVPVLRGVALPRPNATTRPREDVVSTTTLASGIERRYVSGFRYSLRLEWTRVDDAERAAIESAASSLGTVAYVDPLGVVSAVTVGDLEVEPLAGFDPIRYRVALTLREPGIRAASLG